MLLLFRLQSLIVHWMSCIYDLNTRRAPEKVPPLNFLILGSLVCLNSDASVCMVFCRRDSTIVSTLGAHGDVAKLMSLISGLMGVLGKCTCLAS